MKSYSLEDVQTALSQAGVCPGDLIFVQSALYTLGKLEACTARETPRYLVETFLKQISPGGTLGAATFNFNFCSGTPYDRQNTPSKMMGAFNEAVRRHPQARRSRHPMQSAAFVGPLTEVLTSADPVSGYGPGSPFAQMLEHGAKLLLLGCGFSAASFVHYVEEQLQVPYRYQKNFSGTYTDHGRSREANYQMFVRRLDMNTEVNELQIEDWMRDDGHLIKIPLGGEFLRVCTFPDFFQTVAKRLTASPFALLRHPPTQ